jgi:SIR2-like domain
LPIEGHIERALALTGSEVVDLRLLAAQLRAKEILPILGAGASHDCGMRLAGEIAADLHAECGEDESLRAKLKGVGKRDLGDIAEIIYKKYGDDQQKVLEAVGLDEPDRWPGTGQVSLHFCALRLLARAVREQPYLRKAFSFNYDCCGEAALRAEGFLPDHGTTVGARWLDHADYFCNQVQYQELAGRDGFELVKAHGCAEHYREAWSEAPSQAVAEQIVIRTAQVKSWEGRPWAAAAFRDRVQASILLLIGFSGQDVATTETLKEVLEEVYKANPGAGRPRLVVIDHEPDTEALRGLIAAGVGPDGVVDGAVTKISTKSSSTTAVLMTLVVEMIALELEESLQVIGYALPTGPAARLALLGLAGPPMARWSFLLDNSPDKAFIQRVNAAMYKVPSYVPLRYDNTITARSLKIRHELRERFGLSDPERPETLGETDGFVVHAGRAYMPVGLTLEQLKEAHRGGALDQVKDVLPRPAGLSSILVCDEGGDLQGVTIEKGRKVRVP